MMRQQTKPAGRKIYLKPNLHWVSKQLIDLNTKARVTLG
jgi:hypothetical protein